MVSYLMLAAGLAILTILATGLATGLAAGLATALSAADCFDAKSGRVFSASADVSVTIQ